MIKGRGCYSHLSVCLVVFLSLCLSRINGPMCKVVKRGNTSPKSFFFPSNCDNKSETVIKASWISSKASISHFPYITVIVGPESRGRKAMNV